MPIAPLRPEALRRVCDPTQFSFETTTDLTPVEISLIGQPRGVRAIEFGIGIQSEGYNVFVVGETGTGRLAAIERFLRGRAVNQEVPHDWLYVHNFSTPHQPKALSLPAGTGQEFRDDMQKLIEALKKDLPAAFATDAYRATAESRQQAYKLQRDNLIADVRGRAAQEEMAIVDTPSGLVVMPMVEGKAMTLEEYQQLPVETYQDLDKKRDSWREELDDTLRKVRDLDKETAQQMKELSREVAAASMAHYFDDLRARYQSHQDIPPYMDAVYDNILDNLPDFFPPEGEDEREIDLRRYEVNLLVDNAPREGKPGGAPVVVELNPRYSNLLGRMEYDMQFGMSSTHFTNIKAGSLHRANGGYLLINVRDLLNHRQAWEALKRTIKAGEIKLQTPDRSDGNQVQAKSLDPEPIPLNVKILLLGGADYYFSLYNREEDFGQLFKVKAEFDGIMPRDTEHELAYAEFVAGLCQEEKLRHFDRTAVARLVEFGSRLCGHQNRLSSRFGIIGDIVREASYWAGRHQRDVVTADDVKVTLTERTQRSNLEEEHILREISERTLFIDTAGDVVGQVNGLSVIDVGDYSFGQPGRITARTFKGERGIINIDREVDLTDPIHHKGLLSLTGYLGGTYAQTKPFSLSASVTFEQNYGFIAGDSASSAELYVILSSLGELPLKQGIAVTGSVNQHGEIQPIGGIVEKIEGFFKVCQTRSLTGQQGVILPRANIPNLMLSDEVIEAVAQGTFSIWAIESIDEGMEILTGRVPGQLNDEGEYPEGSVHHAVIAGIERLAEDDDEEDEEDDDEDDGSKESKTPPTAADIDQPSTAEEAVTPSATS